MLLPIDGSNGQVELAANLTGGTGPSYADGNDAEMGQPIIFSEADILSFSVDQASLNMSPSAQVRGSDICTLIIFLFPVSCIFKCIVIIIIYDSKIKT